MNQSPPLIGLNLYASNPVLQALVEGMPQTVIDGLQEHGRLWGAADSAELARLANRHAPSLTTHDAYGNRVDTIEFHPAYHALMRRSMAAGLHASVWDAAGEEAAVRTMARAARLFVTAAIDTGHLAGLSSTHAGVAALGRSPELAEAWLPRILSRRYDQAARPPGEKSGLTMGLALIEKQAGGDRDNYRTEAREVARGQWLLTGHKWFLSAPDTDGFLTVAHALEGLSAYLVPRIRADGSRNAVRIVRLKDTLGQRSGAVAEVELDEAEAWLVGERGRGEETIADTLALMRLDSAVAVAGMAHAATAEAVHHSRHRRVKGLPLIDQPLMTRVLADVALDTVAAAALTFRLAESYDRAGDDPAEAAFARLMTPVARYWITRVAPAIVGEAMECLGGNGVVETGRMARLYRDVPTAAMRDGAGNAMCVEVMRLLRRSSEMLESVLNGIEDALGANAKSSLNVLRAATAVALADEGSSRILVEQLAMTAAAAALRRRFPTVVADAFLETRLSKPWRSSYGMLDSRFDSKQFLNYLFPPL